MFNIHILNQEVLLTRIMAAKKLKKKVDKAPYGKK